jgi:YHS domain-containing protein
MTVDPQHAAAEASYGGRQYFFCNPGCRDTFVAAAHAHDG